MSVSEKWMINQNWYEVTELSYGTRIEFNEEFEPENTTSAAREFADYAENNLKATDLYEKAINVILGDKAVMKEGKEVILPNRTAQKAEETLKHWYVNSYEQ